MSYDLIKRALDACAAGIALVLLSPLLLGVGLLVRLRLGTPVLFTQLRPGLGGRPFSLVKFRTMTHERDASGRLLSDADRLTPFGSFLRRTSLDELARVVERDLKRGHESRRSEAAANGIPAALSWNRRRRHEVRPGLTGWAQSQWPQRDQLGGKVQAGRVVRRKPSLLARPAHSLMTSALCSHAAASARWRGDHAPLHGLGIEHELIGVYGASGCGRGSHAPGPGRRLRPRRDCEFVFIDDGGYRCRQRAPSARLGGFLASEAERRQVCLAIANSAVRERLPPAAQRRVSSCSACVRPMWW
jgi:hypothetical protein